MSNADLNGDGVFWLPAQPDRIVPGTLSYTPGRPIRLDLIGHFGEEVEVMGGVVEIQGLPEPEKKRSTDRILGLSNGKIVTLDECRQSGSQLQSPGILRERFIAHRAMVGAHLDADEIRVDCISLNIEGLQQWWGKSGISVSMTHDVEGKKIVALEISHKTLDVDSYESASGFRIESGTTWSLKGDHITRSEITEDRYISFYVGSAVPIDEVLPFAQAMQDLLSIVVDRHVRVECIDISHPDFASTGEAGAERRRKFVELVQSGTRDVDGDVEALGRNSFAFGADDIGGARGVAAWVEVTTETRPAIGMLLSSQYTSSMYLENRFLNVCIGAEALHRILFPAASRSAEKRIHLSHRFRVLADRANASVNGLIPDPTLWGNTIATARNELTHVRSTKEMLSRAGGSLSNLSRSLYYVAIATVLSESDVLRPAIAPILRGKRASYVFSRIADDLALVGKTIPSQRAPRT